MVLNHVKVVVVELRILLSFSGYYVIVGETTKGAGGHLLCRRLGRYELQILPQERQGRK